MDTIKVRANTQGCVSEEHLPQHVVLSITPHALAWLAGRQDCSIEDLSCPCVRTTLWRPRRCSGRRHRRDPGKFKFIFHAESVPTAPSRLELPFDRAVDVEGTRQIQRFYGVVDRYEQLVEEPELVLV